MKQINGSLDIHFWKPRRLPVHSMNLKKASIIVLFSALHVKALASPSQHLRNPVNPNLVVIVGILSVMLPLLFLLLAYTKFCPSALSNDSDDQEQEPEGVLRSVSGLQKSIIDSLPFFTFLSLKGSKEGLECAVCLSKFEDIEVLRLLPRCKHAFHINCIDKWLESHSSCPLCRYKFDTVDLRSFSFTNSLRYPRNSSNLSEEPNIELFIQREQEHHKSSRFNMVSSLQKLSVGRKEDQSIPRGSRADKSDRDLMHKFKHKIFVSDLIYRSRWSDVNSSNLLCLRSEMLNLNSSKIFSPFKPERQRFGKEFLMNESIFEIKEDIERKRLYVSKVSKVTGHPVTASSPPIAANIGLNQKVNLTLLDSAEKRSKSEIINFPRYAEYSARNRTNESSVLSRSGRKDEIIRKLWLSIATRTVQWFADRERGLDWKRSPLNV
ncbi:E3 ubiquitin-protein ligase ATL42-like [Coffea arabica]|uniref:RING-type E3 ubiquitin transferase n=1 Tax=Coffea arabica TaxID=13443 RepID=A0A6P6TXG7_COFAR|nr:E3 ubiquitin-protein ligase ATL42-like [Coffea arabica]